jgi:hypothetical protein
VGMVLVPWEGPRGEYAAERKMTMPGHTPIERKKSGIPPLPAVPQPKIMNREEFRILIERRIRERYDLSLDEFAEDFRAGKFGDDLAALDLAVIAGATSR